MQDLSKGVGLAIAAVVFIIVISLILMFTTGTIQRATANWRGETQVIEDTQANSAFRQQAYDHFYDLCSAVQGHENRIAMFEEELAGNPLEVREKQLQQSLSAVKAQRGDLITQYNQDARKEWTQGQFRAEELPYQLNMEGTNQC